MATSTELKEQITSKDFQIQRLQGRTGLKKYNEVIALYEKKITAIQDSTKEFYFNADLGRDWTKAEELAYLQRIVQENQVLAAQTQQTIDALNAEIATLRQSYDTALAQEQSQKAQAEAAQAQTATAPTTNGEPAPVAAPLSSQQQTNVNQANSGQLSNQVQQSQDPVAANQQNNQGGTGQPKSEANFSADTGQNSAASVSGNSGVSDGKQKLQEVGGVRLKNKLHDYTSYTYRITLFLLTKNDYNSLSSNPTKFVPTFSLISSGAGFAKPGSIKTETTRKVSPFGGYEDITTTQTRAGRHPDFQTDFFIDNLKLMTSVGLNYKSKASNVTEISFVITEPYGLSLLDRLLSANETSGDNNPNYMEQPYLLQIDLLSSPSDEQLLRVENKTSVIDTKRVAIKFVEMKISPSAGGTTYAVRAIPFNHTAFSLTSAAMPVAMSVEAGTVGEFFSSKDDLAKLFGQQVAVDEERIENQVRAWLSTRLPGIYQPSAEEIAAYRKTLVDANNYNSKSLAAGYNGYMDKVAKEQKLSKLPPTKIAFSIPDSTIANSPIVNDTAQTTDGRMAPTTGTVGKPDVQNKKTQVFNLNAGESIIDVIDKVMSKSKYIKDQLITKGQVNDTNKETKANRSDKDTASNIPLNWYKIIPTVGLADFDTIRNSYSKTILYTILPYKTPNSYHPNFPQTTAQRLEDQVVRQYDYFYTGLNQDILRLDIDFDSSFYTQLTTKPGQVARLGTDRDSDQDNKLQELDQFSLLTRAANSSKQQSNPAIRYEISGQNRKNSSMNASNDPTEQVIGDLKQSLYTSQRGDALNIKLEITGDPDFIKQDDIYYNPGSPAEYAKFMGDRLNNSQAPISKSGQILFDAEQVFVKVSFKNAVDIDDKIGIVNKQDRLLNGKMTDGTFSGIYRVLRVESNFSRGQFTQVLEMVRMIDSAPTTNVKAPDTTQSGASTQTQSAKQSEESDNSKRSIIAAAPDGLAPTVSPALQAAANQPALPGVI